MESDCFFNIGLDSKIILYAYNNLAVHHCRKLKELGYKVVAYVDRRANELCDFGTNIVDIDSVKIEGDLNDYVVIIMLSNATQHDNVAREIYEKYNISRILYVPMDTELDIESANILRDKYNMFLNYQYSLLSNIPIYRQKDLHKELEKRVQKFEDNQVEWVSFEMIYTGLETEQYSDLMRKYADIPIVALKPYMELYEYLDGKDVDILPYLKTYFGNVNNWNCVLEHRRKLYDVYLREFNNGMDFFVTSAPMVKWNDKGYFNLTDGQHRCVFLIKMGLKYLPVRMKKQDFLKMYNSRAVNDVLEYIKQNNIKKLKTHIESPLFNNFQAEFDDIGDTVLKRIQEFFGNRKMNKMTVIDMSLMDGYFARNALRMGAQQVVCYVEDDLEVIEAINKMLCIQRMTFKQNLDISEKYDIVFAGECNDLQKLIYYSTLAKKNIFVHIKNQMLIDEFCEKYKYESVWLKSYLQKNERWLVYVIKKE